MANDHGFTGLALVASGLLALTSCVVAVDDAHAEDATVRHPVVRAVAARPRAARTAAVHPLLIRRRAAVAPVGVVGGPGFYGDDQLLRQHAWNDPRLSYFGPFRTGGQVFYGDQAGSPITRGNAGLGMIAGYGAANGGYGGPHFDSVGGFHGGPGPDVEIDADYASGSLSRPDYAVAAPVYPSVTERVAALDGGVVPRSQAFGSIERAGVRKVITGRGVAASSEAAKAAFSAPMRHEAPLEAAFANGGLPSVGFETGDDAF